MTATRKTILALAASAVSFFGTVAPSNATLVSEPSTLYAAMKAQFDTGSAHGWKYADWLDYFTAVLDAGRAYALHRADDPNALEVAGLAIDVATKLNYDPLSNRDASEWYVRDAARKTIDAGDPRAPQARALLARLDAMEASPAALARAAELGVTAQVQAFPSDRQAAIVQLETTWNAWLISKDPAFRNLAMQRAAQAPFPLGTIADPVFNDLVNAAREALPGGPGYTPADVTAAQTVLRRRAEGRDAKQFAKPAPIPKDKLLASRAPLDEYFGRMKMSVLGIRLEIARINQYLDVGWGTQMASRGALLVDALDAWYREYPHDSWLLDAMLGTYKMLKRIDDDGTNRTADQMRRRLIVEFTNTAQARELLST